MKLLLAVDDSKFSDAALNAVVSQCPIEGTEVEVLNVVDLEMPIPTSYAAGFRQESLRHGGKIAQRAAQILSDAGFKVLTEVAEGDPEEQILSHAKDWKADLIVMGSHSRKGLDHFLTGSVSEAVERHADCSVEIVRQKAAFGAAERGATGA